MKRTLLYKDYENKKIKTGSTVEQNFINYASIPSLESMAIIKVATAVCRQSDIKNALRQHSFDFGNGFRGSICNESLNRIEKSIVSKLSFLPLPTLLTAEVSYTIRPLILQILECMHCFKDVKCINSVYFDADGTINREKTLQQFIDEDLTEHNINIYKLACKYCLESCIPKIWNKLPKCYQTYYLYRKNLYKVYDTHLLAYWISIAKNDLSGFLRKVKLYDPENMYDCNHSVYKNMFTLSVSKGNIMAVRYFWKKLTDEEVTLNLTEWITSVIRKRNRCYGGYQKTNEYVDILCFLLSQINDGQQQVDIFKESSGLILNSLFYYWPWQRFLLPTLPVMWPYVNDKIYIKLLSIIVQEIKEGKTTEVLLRKIWYISPISLRKCFIQYIIANSFHGTDVLCNSLLINDLVTIEVVLKDANIDEKKQMIFSLIKSHKIFNIFLANKLALFDILVERTLTLECDVNDMKEALIRRHGINLCHHWICSDNFQMVEKFFRWASTSPNQIDYFKNDLIDKIRIVFMTLHSQHNFELVDKFLNWYYSSEQEIIEFKKHFAFSRHEIVRIGKDDWDLLERFINWCFISEGDINEFKLSLSQSVHIQQVIYISIVFDRNCEFVDKLISWCCHSNEEIIECKKKIVQSETWQDIVDRLGGNYKVDDGECSNWELTRKLIKLFSPFEEVDELKEILKNCTDFDSDGDNWVPDV